MTDIRQWLESLGLDHHAEAFEENEIDWDVLPQLDHQVLKDIGVSAAGSRLRILKAVEALHSQETAETIGEAAPPHAITRPTPIGKLNAVSLPSCFAI